MHGQGCRWRPRSVRADRTCRWLLHSSYLAFSAACRSEGDHTPTVSANPFQYAVPAITPFR
ncbi:hypothetical protein Pd630_LPD06667 [Rhodococcus opacus PD630]|nr:hypothetical protein Pd630_LPD06667 [Rhodococcus opacus PD630]